MAYGSAATQARNEAVSRRSAQSSREWANWGSSMGGITHHAKSGQRIIGGRVVQTKKDPNAWRNGGGGGSLTRSGSYPTGGPVQVAKPTMPTLPAFKAPEWDEGEVRSLSRKRSAPQISKLREAVQVASSKTYDNPNVQRMTLRSALAGYGEGLGAVTGAADESARREYGQRYALEQQEALTNYQAKTQLAMQDWQNSWNLYNMAMSQSQLSVGPPPGGFTGKLDF